MRSFSPFFVHFVVFFMFAGTYELAARSPCFCVCKSSPESPECMNCCTDLNLDIGWNCKEKVLNRSLRDKFSPTSENQTKHENRAKDGDESQESNLQEDSASCCTKWSAKCWNESSLQNNYFACKDVQYERQLQWNSMSWGGYSPMPPPPPPPPAPAPTPAPPPASKKGNGKKKKKKKGKKGKKGK